MKIVEQFIAGFNTQNGPDYYIEYKMVYLREDGKYFTANSRGQLSEITKEQLDKCK